MSADERKFLAKFNTISQKILKRAEYGIKDSSAPSFNTVFNNLLYKFPGIKNDPVVHEIKQKAMQIYAINFFEYSYRSALKKAEEQGIKHFVTNSEEYLKKVKPRIVEQMMQRGVSKEVAESIADAPVDRHILRGYAGELVVETLMRAAYGNRNYYGEAGNIFAQPKVYTKGKTGEYLTADGSIKYVIPEEGTEHYFFLEVKTAPKKNGEIMKLVDKYAGKTIDTTDGVRRSRRGILALLGNEEIDFKTKLDAYKRGVVIIDKNTFNLLMDHYSPEVKQVLKTENRLKEKYKKMNFNAPKDPLKFLDKESRSLKRFLERQKELILAGKEIRREQEETTFKTELKQKAESSAVRRWQKIIKSRVTKKKRGRR